MYERGIISQARDRRKREKEREGEDKRERLRISFDDYTFRNVGAHTAACLPIYLNAISRPG